MKIKSIHLREFKRFTDLKISGLPETAKLVVLVGPNGCGKSCVFDALHGKAVVQYVYGMPNEQAEYWNKTYSLESREESHVFHDDKIKIEFHGEPPQKNLEWIRAVYARSAYRNDPVLRMTTLGRVPPIVEERRLVRMIDNDGSVRMNYQRLVSETVEELYQGADRSISVGALCDKLVGKIRTSMEKLFNAPKLHLNSLGNPLTDGTFRFSKDRAKQYSYENLSGGEKAAFDLVLDLVLKVEEYKNTIFCIDEPEAHMSLRTQAHLLKELYKLIPDNCQLWIATHSVGMMRAAYEIEQTNPDTVVFLNFDRRDFDDPQVITPSKISRQTWANMHHIVLEDLAALIVPNRIILCEGKAGKDGFDANCYNDIFSDQHPDTLFVSTGGKGEGANYSAVIKEIVKADVVLLRDKDNLADPEVEEQRANGKRVLRYQTIEDYLLHDDILRALCEQHGRDASTVNAFLEEKRKKLSEKNDSAKAIVNDLRTWTINNLRVKNVGDSAQGFLRHTMVPLIQPGTTVYRELEEDIFGTADSK